MELSELMDSVWNDSLDGIVITDENTMIVDANPAYCQLAGYTRAELVGQKTNVIRSGLTPRSTFDDMWKRLRSRGKWVGELVNQRRDGTIWISFLSITMVRAPQGQFYFVGIARDLTDHRNLEEQLRQQSNRLDALLGSIESGVVMLDPDGRCIVVNRLITSILGCEEADLLKQDRSQIEEQLGHFFERDGLLSPKSMSGSETIRTREPQTRHFTALWGPVVTSTGTALGQIFTFRDITPETEVDRLKGEFIATVSHELRTPMTSVKGALGLLLGGAAGTVAESQRELLTIAQNNIDRLIRLINDILDLSRIESGRLELHRQPTRVNDIVAVAVRALETVRQERRHHLINDLAGELPLALADQDRIGQVLINLLGNAYKFTDPGGSITITTRRHETGILISVKDTGHGIPKDDLTGIFERFQRASGVASRKAGGTGLGLAIAQSIVQEHGGRIWAESESGKGTTLYFTLPQA